jgi:hypothetical protein
MNFFLKISNIEYLPPENSTSGFDQGRTLVLPSQGLTEFSQISHLSSRRHKFYPRIFSTQISNIEYLPPENSTFDFDQGHTLVLPSQGLTEFSQMSHLIGRKHNFYPRIFQHKFRILSICLLKIPHSILFKIRLYYFLHEAFPSSLR